MTTAEKNMKFEAWMIALTMFKVRFRKCLQTVLASSIPLIVVRQAINDILDTLEEGDMK